MIFASNTAAAIWKEHHCDRCFEPAQAEQRLSGRGRGCMILNRAMTNKTVPSELVKGRTNLMAEAFRCTEFAARPASTRPRASVEVDDEPGLFDLGLFSVAMDGEHS